MKFSIKKWLEIFKNIFTSKGVEINFDLEKSNNGVEFKKNKYVINNVTKNYYYQIPEGLDQEEKEIVEKEIKNEIENFETIAKKTNEQVIKFQSFEQIDVFGEIIEKGIKGTNETAKYVGELLKLLQKETSDSKNYYRKAREIGIAIDFLRAADAWEKKYLVWLYLLSLLSFSELYEKNKNTLKAYWMKITKNFPLDFLFSKNESLYFFKSFNLDINTSFGTTNEMDDRIKNDFPELDPSNLIINSMYLSRLDNIPSPLILAAQVLLTEKIGVPFSE